MQRWLRSLDAALEGCATPTTFFFRDDDGGWCDDRLLRLVELFDARLVPLDVAVIPDALTPALARELRHRTSRTEGRLGLHQHGRAHLNHETSGRKCEFGPARVAESQRGDLVAGRQRLRDLLGVAVDPIFTPPWNRCGENTIRLLRELGFEALSRDRGARPPVAGGLLELPVTLDWMRHRAGDGPDTEALGCGLAAADPETGPFGVMLHHAVMRDNDFARLDELLDLLAGHPRARCVAMRDLLARPARRTGSC